MFCFSFSLCHKFFHLLARKPNLEKKNVYSNKFFHTFHLSESSFTCPGLRASGLLFFSLCFFKLFPKSCFSNCFLCTTKYRLICRCNLYLYIINFPLTIPKLDLCVDFLLSFVVEFSLSPCKQLLNTSRCLLRI